MSTKLAPDNITDELLLQIARGPFVKQIVYLDSNLNALDDLALGTDGGNVRLIGFNFSNLAVKLDDVTVSNVTIESNTSVIVDMPAKSAGGYNLTLIDQDTGDTTIKVYGVEYSAFPAWSTEATIPAKLTGTNFTVNLSAPSDSNVVYTVATGSTLPGNLTLASNGLLSGNVVVESQTVYNFNVVATDQENQDTTRTFSVTIVPPDPFFKNTSMMLQAQENSFLNDASDNKFTLNGFNDVRPSNFSPYNTAGWATFIDGSDYFEVTQNASLAFQGGGAFTWETWINFSTGGILYGSYTGPSNSGGSFTFSCDSTNKNFGLGWIINGTDSWNFDNYSDNNVLTLNKWQHIAVSYDGNGSLKYFVDGTLVTTRSVTVNVDTMVYNVRIGRSMHPSYPVQFVGYLSNMRFVKGESLYATDFARPTSALTAVTNTVFLGFSTTNPLYDASSVNNTITRSGTTETRSNGPFTETDTTGSGYFDGTGDYINFVDSNNVFNFAAQDWTVELWAYRTSTADATFFARRISSAVYGGFNLGITSSYKPSIVADDNTSSPWAVLQTTGTVDIPINEWCHLAYTRNGSTWSAWVNGQLSHSFTSTITINNTTTTMGIGGIGNGDATTFAGWISDFKVTVGTALYTEAFTPPTEPATASASTSLLTLQSRGGHNNNNVLDKSVLRNALTRNGNASAGTFNPLGLHGWGAYNGGGSFQITNQNDCFNFGSNDFTVEFWARVRTTATQTFFIDMRVNNNTNANLMFFPTGLNHGDGTNILSWATAPYTNNLDNWFHFAIVRNNSQVGDNWCAFVNGVPVDTGSFTSAVNTGNMRIFGRWDNNYSNWNADISNLRVTKKAVYTDFVNGFTPSSTSLEVLPETTVMAFRNSQFLTTEPAQKLTVTAASASAAAITGPFKSHYYTPDSYSVYFDGADDVVTVTGNGAGPIGTQDFTFECWMYVSTYGGTFPRIFEGVDSNAFQVYLSSGTLTYGRNGGGTILSYGVSSLTNSWYHVCITRSGDTHRLFIDGVLRAYSASNTASMVDSATWRSLSSGGGIIGCVSNIRIVRGSVLSDYVTSSSTTGASIFVPPTAPLTKVTGTSFLSFQSSTLVDNSDNSFPITSGAQAQPTKFNPFGETLTTNFEYSPATHGGSWVSDGTTDYYKIPHSDIQSLRNNDFTIEFWFYPTATLGNASCLLTKGWGSYAPYLFYINGANLLFYASASGSSWDVSNAQVIGAYKVGAWNHVTVTRKGTAIRGFMNGAAGFSITSSATLNVNTTTVTWGAADNGTSATPGPIYYSGLNIVNGTCLYEAAFVPSEFPRSVSQNTVALIASDSAAIQDKTSRNNIETLGNTQIVPESAYRVNQSVYFDGSSYLNMGSSNDNTIGTQACMVEAWVYRTAATTGYVVCSHQIGGMFYFSVNSSGNVGWALNHSGGSSSTSSGPTSTGTVPLNTWTHIAGVRKASSTEMRIYINGVLDTTGALSATNVGSYGGAKPFYVGAGPDTGTKFTGYLNSVRYVLGDEVYTGSSFTLPTAPPEAITGTRFLVAHNRTFIDGSGNFVPALAGTPLVKSLGPFTETQADRRSIYFDGTGDYMWVTNKTYDQPLTADFTIEAWVYVMSGQNTQGLINTQPHTTIGISLNRTGIGDTYVYIGNGSSWTGSPAINSNSASKNLKLNCWNHVALVRSGSTITLYHNGEVAGTTTTLPTGFNSGGTAIGAVFNTTPSEYLKGYLEDFRVTKYARYTSAFTPPTERLIAL